MHKEEGLGRCQDTICPGFASNIQQKQLLGKAMSFSSSPSRALSFHSPSPNLSIRKGCSKTGKDLPYIQIGSLERPFLPEMYIH